MKTPILKNLLVGWPTRRTLQKLVLPALCLTSASALAATEQWLGVPGTTATTNWTDSANWTPSVNQTYYNEVQFTTAGASANNNFTINNVLDAATGVAQMPIWQLDYIPVNGNYTTLINPGVTLQLDAGWGSLYVGADSLNNSSPAPADAVETIAFTGPGAAISIAGGIYLGQGSTTPGDTHNVTLDFSGVDHFTMNSSHEIYVASGGLRRGNGSFYLAKTNNIVLGNVFQICNQSMSNSLPCVVELGIANDIAINGNNLVVGGGGAVAGAVLKFNPAFIGGATVPSAYFHSGSGRIATVYIGNGNGGAQTTSTGVCDFSGGNVYLLADSMQLGQAGAGNATGTLTFDNNYVDANNVIVGNQTAGSGGAGIGIVNLNNNVTLGTSSTLLVNQTLTLAAAAGTLTPGTAGTVNINGGALSAKTIVNGAGNGTINLNGGSLTLGTTAGTVAAPVSNLNTTNSTMTLTIAAGTTNIYATSLQTGGTTNLINISAAPAYPSYPVQVPLIKYGSLGGAGFNFGVGSLPPLYAGHLVNNTLNGSIDIVFTSGSSVLTWNGNVNADWDTTTANWLAGGIYADGQVVQFFDGASSSTVNLTTTLSPSSLTVSNAAQNFTFNGSGALAGSTSLVKAGTGTLILDNSGNNNYSGGTTISGGMIQVGNNDANGNLPSGNVVNNGTLAIARSDSQTLNNAVSGSGSLVQSGGTLVLSGNNSYTGNTLVTNNGALQLGSGSALGGGGSTIIANGSTLDINGNYLNKPLVLAGSGVDGNGALVNNGGGVYGFASQIILTGDTTFGYVGRCDLNNASIGTGGNPYNLTINTPSAYFEWQNISADSALANINFVAGSWGWKNLTPTSFGNPAGLLTLTASTTVTIWNTSIINKNVDFQGGLMVAYSANNVMSGNMTLEDGYNTFQMNGGCSLTLSNTLTGSANATLYVSGGTGSLTLAGTSPSYLGNVYVNQGTLALNGSIGGTVTAKNNTTLTGSGASSGLVDVNGTFYPGDSGVAGTFTAGGLSLEGNANLIMDLSSSLASGNDAIQVNGDLTMNGNNIGINPVNNILANGTYNLIAYTGSFNGSIGTAATTYPTAYTLVLTNNTAAKKIQVIVSGTLNPSALIWNNASSSGQWDVSSSANWSNVTTHASASVFNTLDSVLLDDSILTTSPAGTNISIAGTVVPSAITNNSSANYTLSGSGAIGGSGGLVKLGTGTLSLNVHGGFTGPVTIGGGIIKTVGNNTLGSVASITIASGGTLDFAGNAYNRTNAINISGAGANGVGALTNSGGAFYDTVLNLVLANDTTVNENPNGRWDFAVGSSISGAHQLTFNGAGGYGEIKTTTIAANLSGFTITNGQLGLQHMEASCLNPATVFTVAGNGVATIWSGGFNGSFALMPGAQLNLYSGTYTVASGATLSGVGSTVNGTLVVGTGATLSPSSTASATTTGKLTVTGSATLNGTTVLRLNGNGTNDSVQGNSISYGGALTLTNISATALAAGDSFQLFNSASISGTFSSTNLPALGAGLAWDLSQLNTGKINVIASGGSGPTIGNTTVSGGQLIFNGTGGTEGNSYAVLTTTNLASANWTSVATNTFGPGGVFSVTNAVNSSTPQQFYRIKLLP